MQTLILTLHIIVCVLLVILVLLQAGKEGMGVIFGGGNSSVFGSGGAGGILAKLTALMALIFVITSLSYTYVTSSRPTVESVILKTTIEEPAVPPVSVPTQTSPDPAPVEPVEPAKEDTAGSGPAPEQDKTQVDKEKPVPPASTAP